MKTSMGFDVRLRENFDSGQVEVQVKCVTTKQYIVEASFSEHATAFPFIIQQYRLTDPEAGVVHSEYKNDYDDYCDSDDDVTYADWVRTNR